MSVWYHSGDWIDGPVVLPVDDLGVFQGAMAVERMRTYSGHVFRIGDHLRRLQRSIQWMSIDPRPTLDSLSDRIADLLTRNAVAEDTGITALVSPGTLQHHRPTVVVHLAALDLARIERLQTEGERLMISEIRQPADAAIPRELKHRSRIHYYLAAQQVRQTDPLATAILRDDDGSLTETASANLLLVRDGVLFAAPQNRVLPGISLSVVRQLAAANGIPWCEKPLTTTMFDQADEILLTGTGAGIWFGNDRRGPIYQQLAQAFCDLTTNAST